jgi:CHAT domain-containing protein
LSRRATALRAGALCLTLAVQVPGLAPVARAQSPPAACPVEQAAPPPAGPSDPLLLRADAVRSALDAGQGGGAAAQLEALAADVDTLPEAERARVWLHLGRSWVRLAARAAASFERAEAAARSQGQARLRSYALGYRAEVYERAGRQDEALALYDAALRAALAGDAPDALYRWLWHMGRIERARGHDARALELYRRAAATLAELRQRAARAAAGFEADAGVDALYFELVDLLLAAAAPAGADARQALLRETLATLEARKAEELRDYFRDECLLAQRQASPDEIPGAVVVYPVVLADRVELVVGGSGGLVSRVSRVSRATLEAEVDALRHQLTRRTTREYLTSAETLYDWLIRPIQAEIEARRPEALVFAPDGPLRTIPMAALHDRETQRFLIEMWPLAIVPSLSLTDPRPLPRRGLRVLAAGLTEPVAGYPPLANVEPEIRALTAEFPGRTLLNGDFEADRFEEAVGSQPYGIVHVASHAEFLTDASQSFLLAWDGPLPMDRLAEVVAATRFRTQQPLELLTLSACETAAGDERAALGLAGIALRAGARSALATLWSVNDQSAAELVTGFYAQLGDPETSRARALQRAQLALLERRGTRHPAFWAPFVLISSWL